MPLLTTFLESMNTSHRISANLRYCDSRDSRHISSGNSCAFATPSITSLVPSEQRHPRVRNGLECSHFSFNAIRGASLQARIHSRFESIENDRQENMVDILNSINEKSADSSDLLRLIISKIDSEGTACQLLKTISDAFRTEGPITQICTNTTTIAQFSQTLINENQKLKEDLNRYHSENKTFFQNAFDKLVQQNNYGLQNMQQINTIGVQINSKIGSIVDSVGNELSSVPNVQSIIKEINGQIKQVSDLSSDNAIELKEVKETISSNEVELSSVKYELQLLGTLFERNGIEMKQELNEMKQELREIKEEMYLLKEAITDVLPNKLMDAFKMMTDHYSYEGSDVEVIDSEKIDSEFDE